MEHCDICWAFVRIVSCAGECRKLNEQLGTLRKELNESKSQVLLAEYKRDTDMQEQSRKAQEEIASLQHLVHGESNRNRFRCGFQRITGQIE